MEKEWLTIGEVAARAGLAASALRFYESEGLIDSARSGGGQRRFHRDMLRRIAFVRVAQRVGLTLEEIRGALARLPAGRTPTPADWAALSRSWRPRLDDQIATLERLRDRLTSCIGCGCLSFKACALYNPEDAASSLGPGPRYLLGDEPGAVAAPRGRDQPRATRTTPVIRRDRSGPPRGGTGSRRRGR
jgi:MerR family transcriptional regulator, redox-sensitive transcriptional activator SoxR